MGGFAVVVDRRSGKRIGVTKHATGRFRDWTGRWLRCVEIARIVANAKLVTHEELAPFTLNVRMEQEYRTDGDLLYALAVEDDELVLVTLFRPNKRNRGAGWKKSETAGV
jgi:hypothetical protein